MRAALISIAGEPAPVLAGKTLARRQLDFALAAGCERVIVLGNGSSAEAIALRHIAEAAGASFQVVGNSHALLGTVRAADEVLVLAPGLLPEAPAALPLLIKRGVVVLPAGPGVAAGFERIDVERAWSGAAVISGALVERLADLPADSEPASALMRAALQARVPERRLPETVIADGSWTLVHGDREAARLERTWLERHLTPAPSPRASSWLAAEALRAFGAKMLGIQQTIAGLIGAAVVLLATGVGVAWAGWAAIGLAAIAVGSWLSEVALALRRLRDAPFAHTAPRWLPVLPWLVDVSLAAAAALAIGGDWLHRLFPALVLLAAMRLPSAGRLFEALRDRALLAAILAVAVALRAAEPAIMLAALTLLLLNIARDGAPRA